MSRLSAKMIQLGQERSEIREAFEFGLQRAAQVGAENVFDFSLGNPSVPTPESVTHFLQQQLACENPIILHSYTSAQGDAHCRAALAEDCNRRFGTNYTSDCFTLTTGAAGALCCLLTALSCPGDTFLTIAPYFPEYKVFVESCGAELHVLPPEIEGFQIDFAALELALTPQTKALLINSPNNPSGAVYSAETLRKLAALLTQKSQDFGHTIYLLSDEPYREIVYGDTPAPWVPDFYPHTVICYSFSKSLSLPGARIGYVLIPPQVAEAALLCAAVAGAGRSLGYVCAPTLFQHVAAHCVGVTADLSVYRQNRDLLLRELRAMGFFCVEPGGAFYLLPRALEADARAFCRRAQAHDLLLVPGDSFGAPGHFRLSYCVPTERIERALPRFRALAAEYGLG